MKRTPIHLDIDTVPAVFHDWLQGSEIFDSSCSPEARVYYLDKDNGYFLKSAPKNALKTEADMTRFLSEYQLAAEVLWYFSDDKDWLLTRAVPGEDCTSQRYLDDPKRLCETLATILRQLHSLEHGECPVPNRTATYLETVENNYRCNIFDNSLLADNRIFSSAEEAWHFIEENKHLLKTDTLIHGDYCLPNIILEDWHLSKFIDVGNGGVGDRHIDLFWGIWSLGYNLKTNAYADRFLDAYGREAVEPELLRLIVACEFFG